MLYPVFVIVWRNASFFFCLGGSAGGVDTAEVTQISTKPIAATPAGPRLVGCSRVLASVPGYSSQEASLGTVDFLHRKGEALVANVAYGCTLKRSSVVLRMREVDNFLLGSVMPLLWPKVQTTYA